VIAQRRENVHAVLNGVDYTVWNPAADTDVAARYSADDLAGKMRCREDLAAVFELEHDDRPIVAVISRLLDRKGFDILYAAMDRLLSLPLRMVFMGRGEDRYQLLLGDLARAKPGQVGAMITYEKALAHRIMAGADIFLMPSRYEPCGLEQLYGLKYGTVPVVRATGGLDDTVIDVKQDPENGTGFKFLEYSPDALFDTLADAVEFYGDRPAWRRLMQRGMRQNFSWDRSAAEYEKIYESALAGVRVL
jgi:starch synthase